ncbi:MAG: PQQ-dependent sugar dehydrogenase [Pseudomonadota bacterium]
MFRSGLNPRLVWLTGLSTTVSVLAIALAFWLQPGLLALVPGFSGSSAAPDDGVHTVTVASGLEHPWSLAFLPDGSMLVSERPGRLRHVTTSGTVSPALTGLPAIDARGQGGLLDLALHPDFAHNRLLYFSYAESGDGETNGLAVARARLANDLRSIGPVEVVFRQQPKVRSTGHFGGRLVFDRNGFLFVTLGDRQKDEERAKAQQLDKYHGKIVRVRDDGGIPDDNPFRNTAGAQPGIWSLGHRNVQGAALHPETGELWASEHGPRGGDEINVVKRGRNYGWPVITYGCSYGTCEKIGEGTHKAGMEQPLTWWVPRSTAPSGLAFYTGDRYPGWRGNLFSGSLAGMTLWRLELAGEKITARHALLTDLQERLRDVRQGPDGLLYLLTDSPEGRILRVEPD